MLIERQTEVEHLQSLFSDVLKQRGQIALISGEAGIGKTSLLNAFREQTSAGSGKLRWLAGGCEALFTPRTLGPIHDMANGLDLDVDSVLSSDRGLSALSSTVLDALSDKIPTVMVFEDVHWADHGTLDLIKFVARRISLLPVLLILTFRDNEVDADHPLTNLLGDLPGGITHRYPLNLLSQAAVQALAEEAGRDGDALYRVTDGNPFYVMELLAAEAKPGDIPASVKDAVALRIGQIAQREREFLESISVLPKAPSYDFLEKLAGDEAMDLITSCLARGFLVEDGANVKFRHELSRLAILERIIPSRRRRFHKACLKVLMTMPSGISLDQIVRHASGAFDSLTVLEYAPRAARNAVAAGAHREAAAHYQTALRFVDSAEPELAAELYESWSYEAALCDRMEDEVLNARRHAITLWRALNRPDKVGQNLRHLSRLHWYRGESAEAARLADQAIRVLERLPASSEAAMAYSLRAQYHMLND